ncbi:MAG TPA: PDZ domain-containing protein, partial [Acidimicrobiales bacterium]|nr:PDZ domain-containing protein [Acidimicrobiales bacterium]
WGGGAESGDPLLDPSGAVIGLLYEQDGTVPTYLPSQLILGVADDLRSEGKVLHGWLGVEGADAPSASGAGVTAVVPDGPASGVLHPGDVITGIGSDPVRSMAELRERLYVLAPQTKVMLSVVNGSVTRLVEVTLSSSP